MDGIENQNRKRWSTRYVSGNPEADACVAQISRDAGVSELLSKLLYVRGYRSAQEAARFLRMETVLLHDPFLLTDMQLAVERVEQAIERREKIAIYGDYDVDGVTSVSLLYLYLSGLGADIGYYIPCRSTEGYGMSVSAMDRLHGQGVSLIVTVDTGITATVETAYAASLGMDVVITDHHECRDELPRACAVVNPHRPGDRYPFRDLAGVGVVFKLVCALEMAHCRRNGIPETDGIRRVCMSYADLVAIGTVADVMPVTDENRLMISLGLRRMEESCRLGVEALLDAASAGKDRGKQKSRKKVTSTMIGFVIAPRMNAAGRISRASIAVELLLAEKREEADRLAEQLCELNAERQAEENRIAQSAYAKLEMLPPEARSCVLVLDDDSWHQGVIGIVSSRMTERYGMPSVLITYDGATGSMPTSADVGMGSGRSVKGLNLVEALGACEDLLVRYGGHELAAGLCIRRGDVAAFRERINRYAQERLTEDMRCIRLEADCELSVHELTLAHAEELDLLEPFGVSNPVPCFILRDARLVRIVPMGGGKHLRFILEKNGQAINAVWFGRSAADLPVEPSDSVDLFFQLNINEYQGNKSVQLIVQDMALSRCVCEQYEAQARRYGEICAGAEYGEDEQVCPSREDVAAVYTYLRQEFRAGHTSFPIRRLMRAVRSPDGGSFGYIKLKFIIRILQELQICGVSEPVPDHFLFDIFYPTKTNLENSSILRRLREQQKKQLRL